MFFHSIFFFFLHYQQNENYKSNVYLNIKLIKYKYETTYDSKYLML